MTLLKYPTKNETDFVQQVPTLASAQWIMGLHVHRFYRVRQKDLPYLERALWELWWGYGGVGGIDR
jgi:hypothetical protein